MFFNAFFTCAHISRIKSHYNLSLNNSIILYRSQNTLALIEDLITEYNLLFLFIIILLVVTRC